MLSFTQSRLLLLLSDKTSSSPLFFSSRPPFRLPSSQATVLTHSSDHFAHLLLGPGKKEKKQPSRGKTLSKLFRLPAPTTSKLGRRPKITRRKNRVSVLMRVSAKEIEFEILFSGYISATLTNWQSSPFPPSPCLSCTFLSAPRGVLRGNTASLPPSARAQY